MSLHRKITTPAVLPAFGNTLTGYYCEYILFIREAQFWKLKILWRNNRFTLKTHPLHHRPPDGKKLIVRLKGLSLHYKLLVYRLNILLNFILGLFVESKSISQFKVIFSTSLFFLQFKLDEHDVGPRRQTQHSYRYAGQTA